MSTIIEGEVTGKTIEEAPEVPRNKALREFQEKYGVEHSTQLADFLVIHMAVADTFRRLAALAIQGDIPDPVRARLTFSIIRDVGKLLTDLVVTVANYKLELPAEPTEEQVSRVTSLLTLAQQHHREFSEITARFNEEGQPVFAANDSGVSDTEPSRIVIPD